MSARMETIHHHGPILTVPVGLMPSVMAIPSLATIPGSAAPTPSPHSSGEVPTLSKLKEGKDKVDDRPEASSSSSPPPPPLGKPIDLPTQDPADPPDPYANLDSSTQEHFVTPPSSPIPVRGSYFPAASSSTLQPPVIPALPPVSPFVGPTALSLTTAPSDEPEPAQESAAGSITPVSSYKGKGRAFVFPLKPSVLSSPRRRSKDDGDRTDGSLPVSGRQTPDSPRNPPGRRRASTISGPPVAITAERRGSYDESATPNRRLTAALYALAPSKSLKHFRRRRSVSDDQTSEWQNKSSSSSSQVSLQHPMLTRQAGESQHTLRSDSTAGTIQPNLPSPPISPRKSSLSGADFDSNVILGLSTMPASPQAIEVVVADDSEMPRGPPPRSSSLALDFGSSPTRSVTFSDKSLEADIVAVPATDVNSLLSSSLTTTEGSASASAGFYSPSGSSKEHPLSSATTSLSRSVKSGNEGESDKKTTMSALRLQRSLEWEAKQTRRRTRLEKRRMILFELVETEVAYTQDLKTLVHVYLPQLNSLPGLSDVTAQAIGRNAAKLLEIHDGFMNEMVAVLKEEGLPYHSNGEPEVSSKLEKVARRLAALFVDEVASFSAYNEFCAGSITAASLVRRISYRPDFDLFERRCQIISGTFPHQTLEDLLEQGDSSVSLPAGTVRSPPQSPGKPRNRNRLHFRDYLIMPIQRVCRYPLLLAQLLNAAVSPSPTVERDESSLDSEDGSDTYDVGVDVERALGAMKGVAEEADEARRVKDAEIKTATIIDRLEPHPALSPKFLNSLGKCRLIGSLDVLHHHPTIAPLVPPVKVKYLAAFLYKGYLILAKVKKGKTYEVKHYLPLEVFELINITEGFLPHSIRLSLREHNFDLAASCEAEKEVWSAALNDAREQSTMPPFELPASVSPFAARRRRMSAVLPFGDHTAASGTPDPSPESKRHTVIGALGTMEDFSVTDAAQQLNTAAVRAQSIEEEVKFTTPTSSPTRSTFGFTPDRAGKPSTVLLKRATAPQRLMVDRGVGDIISESCATARSKAQLHQVLFLPDVPVAEIKDKMSIRDSTMLRRRRSFLDSSTASFDIAFTGEVRGSVIPVRHQHRASFDTPRSHGRSHTHDTTRRNRAHSARRPSNERPKLFAIVPDSSTEAERPNETDDATSDIGTLTQGGGTTALVTRTNSVASLYTPVAVSPLNTHHPSLSNLRQAAFEMSDTPAPPHTGRWSNLNKRKTASAYHLNRRSTVPDRAKSTPSSPHLGARKHPSLSKDLPPIPPLKDLPSLPGKTSMLPPPFFRRKVDRSDESNSTSRSASSQGDNSGSSANGGASREGSNGAMGMLRRSMSIMREKADSFELARPSFSREPSERDVSNKGSVPPSPKSARAPLPGTMFNRPPLSRNQSSANDSRETHSTQQSDESRRPPLSRNSSGYAGGVSDDGDTFEGEGMTSSIGSLGGESEARGASGDEEGSGAGAAGGLRRKKSVRLFQTLSRFTPI